MELSAELFENTVRMIKADSARAHDKRARPRVGVRYRMQIAPLDSQKLGKPIDVWIRDLSQGGVGIMCPKRMAMGAQFVIYLPHIDEGLPLKLLCTVHNCRLLDPGMYAVGADFAAMADAPPAAENGASKSGEKQTLAKVVFADSADGI